MRFLWIFFILAVFVGLEAKSHKQLPPAEMIFMDIFGSDDDVESVEETEEFSKPKKPIKDKKYYDTQEEPTELIIKSRPKKSSELFKDFEEFETIENARDYEYKESIDLSNYKSDRGANLKIALLVPKKVIGAYADSVSNSIISYLLFKDAQFQFEVFDSVDEQDVAILQKLQEIRAKGYNMVIAPMTQKGAEIISNSVDDMLVFIPTINRSEIVQTKSNIIFGGLDYRKQIDALLTYANDKIVLFNDGSRRSFELSDYIKQKSFEDIVYAKEITNIKTNLTHIIRKNHKLKKASIFLNMPVVKSSLIASQLTQHKVTPHVLLSTQANYNPMLFKLTQVKDREFLYIANSISYPDKRLKDINLILGNNPDFSWIDYSTSIGMDYIYASQLGGSHRVFLEDMYENQIDYKVRVERAGDSSFEPIGSAKFRY
jgi:hypothetical protein